MRCYKFGKIFQQYKKLQPKKKQNRYVSVNASSNFLANLFSKRIGKAYSSRNMIYLELISGTNFILRFFFKQFCMTYSKLFSDHLQ